MTEDEARTDPILRADDFEEQHARAALLAATNTRELVDAWFERADHFEGEARLRLQDTYNEVLARYITLRAG